MFRRISIDITGFCNAKCKWCVTGRKNREQGHIKPHYMPYGTFMKVYGHLYQHKMIDTNTEIMLYSWGEPFLNPDYIKIIEYLSEKNQTFAVSTNASKVQLTEKKNVYKNCDIFIFSMSGFSQESYNHIHGFAFEQVKKNITEINRNLRESGFHGTGLLSYHVYKFNTHEIEDAEQFANTLNLKFDPYYPYFNGNSMTELYLEGKMEDALKKEAEQELFLSHVKGLLQKRPSNYHCFLENILSIDCYGNLVLCCASDDGCADYVWTSVFEIDTLEQMKEKRQEMLRCGSCSKCRSLGIDYWMQYNPSYVKGDI